MAALDLNNTFSKSNTCCKKRINSIVSTQIVCVIITLFCFNTIVYAQKMRPYDKMMQQKHAQKKGYDTLYRVNYFENIILKTEYISDIGELKYINNSNKSTLTLRPISEYKLGVSLDYKWIAIGFSFSPRKNVNSEHLDKKEESNSTGLSLNFFYSDRWRQKLSYNIYNGFYSEITRDNSEDKSIFLGDASFESFEASTFFIINRNFSFRAHYALTERQLKSAGSFIPRIRFLHGKTNINFNNDEFINEIDQISNTSLIAQIGYLHTFVYNKKWYATIGAHPGVGYSYTNLNFYKINNSSHTYNDLGLALKTELSLGYNSYRWFFGAAFTVKNYNLATHKEDEFEGVTDYFSFHLGYRLDDNKPMRKFFGWFEDHLGF